MEVKLSSSTLKEKDIEYSILFSNDISYPLMTYGYNHFILQNMVKLNNDIIKYKDIKKLYLVVEPFEIEIDELDDNKTTILAETNIFIKKINKDIPNITTYHFMNLWEIYNHFKLIPNDKTFLTLHLSDDTNKCYYIEPTIIYREKYNKKNTDIYYLNNDIKNDFIKYYKSKISTDTKNRKMDLITIEINTIDEDYILTEQKGLYNIINMIFEAISFQKNKGTLIIKIYETFTTVMISIIEFLKIYYDDIIIYKPNTSRKYNSENFLICKKFNNTLLSPKINKILKEIEEHTEFNIFKLFNIIINDKLKEEYKDLNIKFMLNKNIGIQNIRGFLNLENKNGTEYFEYLKLQHDNTDYWIKKFL